MNDLIAVRKSVGTWNQKQAAEEFQKAYEALFEKRLGDSYALKRLSQIESGASSATDKELEAIAKIYNREVEEIQRAILIGRQTDSADQTGEQFFAELQLTPPNHDVLICSVYGGARSAINDDDDEYGRLMIKTLNGPLSNVKLAMYVPFPDRGHFATRGENPDWMRLIAAYDTARAYAHDRFEAIRRRVEKGSVALYEPNPAAFFKQPGDQLQPCLAPFNIRQTLVVTIDKTDAKKRIPLKKRLFAWTHDERPAGGTIPQDHDGDRILRQQMHAAWTAWMGEPLACWEQCGRLGDDPETLKKDRPDREFKWDLKTVSRDNKWAWRKTPLSRSISEKYTIATSENRD